MSNTHPPLPRLQQPLQRWMPLPGKPPRLPALLMPPPLRPAQPA